MASTDDGHLAPAPSASVREAGADLPDDASLDDYLRFAALHNPGLRAAYERWLAAVERIPQARALPDPTVSYGYYFESVQTLTGPQRQRLRGTQMFPWLEKLLLRGDAAAEAARAAELHFEAEKLTLFEEVTRAYAEYYYLTRAIAVTRESLALVRNWEALIRARYRVATENYPDLINAQVELGKLDDRMRTLEDLRTPTVALLNDTLGRDSATPVPSPTTLPDVSAHLPDAEALRRLRDHNPKLAALEATVDEYERRTELARKDYFPDVSVGIEWIETGRRSGQNVPGAGEDPVIGVVSLNLPIWWQKYSAGVREAEANRRATERAQADTERSLTTELQFALYRFRDAERKIDLYGNALLPKAREALHANATAYESGRADFLDLLEAQRLFLEFGLSYERALADRTQSHAAVQTLLGAPPLEPEAIR